MGVGEELARDEGTRFSVPSQERKVPVKDPHTGVTLVLTLQFYTSVLASQQQKGDINDSYLETVC